MKVVEIDPAIEQDRDLSRAVHRSNEVLDTELGTFRGLVSARWRLIRDDDDRPLVIFDLWDPAGRVYSVFTTEELKNDSSARGRLFGLWGDLLRINTHKIRDEILSARHHAQGA